MSVTDPLGFNLYLRGLRTARGWSLRDVEKLTNGGVSNAYLSQLESGHIDAPSIITIHRLSAAFGVEFEEMCRHAVIASEPVIPPPVCPTCGRPFGGPRS